MILRYATDLSTQTIIAHGSELANVCGLDIDTQGNRVYTRPDTVTQKIASILGPVLVTDYQSRQQFPPTTRITIERLFQSNSVTTLYDDMTFNFIQHEYPGVRGPSIDTLLFAKSLYKLDFDSVASAAERGCGSGFLSKYLVHKVKGLKQLYAIDINPHAIQCAQNQIGSAKVLYYTGNAVDSMQGKVVDLLICNPPYVPRFCSNNDNPYEGMSLLHELIVNGQVYLNAGGKIIVNYSSLGERAVTERLANSQWNVKVLDEMKVPFKICNILNNQEWMDYLIQEKGLQKENRLDYEYWHTIKIIELS